MTDLRRTPTSVEGFRHTYGRAPTVAEMRACIDYAHPPKAVEPVSNGCDCYDEECTICTPEFNG